MRESVCISAICAVCSDSLHIHCTKRKRSYDDGDEEYSSRTNTGDGGSGSDGIDVGD